MKNTQPHSQSPNSVERIELLLKQKRAYTRIRDESQERSWPKDPPAIRAEKIQRRLESWQRLIDDIEQQIRQIVEIRREAESVLIDERTKTPGLELNQTGLIIDGKHYPLKAAALKMWQTLFDLDGEPAHLKDFGLHSRPDRIIGKMPSAVQRLIKHGKPHAGYTVPGLKSH